MNYSAPFSQWNTSFAHPIPNNPLTLNTTHLAPTAIQSIQPYEQSPTSTPSPTSSSSADSFSTSDSPKKTPRPPNAFMLFRSDFLKRIPDHVETRQQNLSKIAGCVWRVLDEECQKPWYEEADKVLVQHKAKYPDYKYTPRKRGLLGVRSTQARARDQSTDPFDSKIASIVKQYTGLTVSSWLSSKKPKKNTRNAKKVRTVEALERVRTPGPSVPVVHDPVPTQSTSPGPAQFVQHIDQTPPSMQFYPGNNFLQASPAFLPRRPSTSMGFIETASKAHMSDAFNHHQYEVQSEPSSSPSALYTMLASGQNNCDFFNPQPEMLGPQQQSFQRAEQGLFCSPGFGDMSYAPAQQPMFYEQCIAPHQLYIQFPQPTMTPMTTGEMSLPQTPPCSNDVMAPRTVCDEKDLFEPFDLGLWGSQGRAEDLAAVDAQKMVEDAPLLFESDAWNIHEMQGAIQDTDFSLLLTQFGASSL